MAENKTKENDASVEDFLSSMENDQKREDSHAILEMMKNITGLTPKMWGDSMVGFGRYHYKYKSGREGDYFLTGFAPRKKYTSIYIMPGFKSYQDMMAKTGKHKSSVSCLYINKLDDINLSVLKNLINRSVKDMIKIYKVGDTKQCS